MTTTMGQRGRPVPPPPPPRETWVGGPSSWEAVPSVGTRSWGEGGSRPFERGQARGAARLSWRSGQASGAKAAAARGGEELNGDGSAMDGHATSEGHRRQPLPALGLGPWREKPSEGARAYLLLLLPWRPEHPWLLLLLLVPVPPPGACVSACGSGPLARPPRRCPHPTLRRRPPRHGGRGVASSRRGVRAAGPGERRRPGAARPAESLSW